MGHYTKFPASSYKQLEAVTNKVTNILAGQLGLSSAVEDMDKAHRIGPRI